MDVRSRILSWTFHHLYHRLAFAHEAVGWCVCGASWAGRREAVAEIVSSRGGLVMDVGCGDGRLLERVRQHGHQCVGIEPSGPMARRAHLRGCTVVQARIQSVPIHSGIVTVIVSTYPGPWIKDPEGQAELARIAEPGCCLYILLGGSYERGRGALIRRIAARLAYGGRDEQIPELTIAGFDGGIDVIQDQWGRCIVWQGQRTLR